MSPGYRHRTAVTETVEESRKVSMIKYSKTAEPEDFSLNLSDHLDTRLENGFDTHPGEMNLWKRVCVSVIKV